MKTNLKHPIAITLVSLLLSACLPPPIMTPDDRPPPGKRPKVVTSGLPADQIAALDRDIAHTQQEIQGVTDVINTTTLEMLNAGFIGRKNPDTYNPELAAQHSRDIDAQYKEKERLKQKLKTLETQKKNLTQMTLGGGGGGGGGH